MPEDPKSLVAFIEESEERRGAADLVTDPQQGVRNGVLVGSDGELTSERFPPEFADDVTVRTRDDLFVERENGVTERCPYDADPGEVVVEELGGGHPDGYDDPSVPYDRSYTVKGPEQKLARLVEMDAIEAMELVRPQPERASTGTDDEGGVTR